ncbi:MAG: LPS export ABC transporter periplasmic protein LptC [Zoogloeaceae bacterium]|nr:LPS export ABC transporter periplasmic protein LptC [Zoogloeaceae bacterium]
MAAMNLERLFPLLALGLLAAGTVWLERTSRIADIKPETVVRHDPDLMVQSFTLFRYDAAGAEEYRLTGKELKHYPDDDTSHILTPRLVFAGQGRPVTLTSAEALVFQQGDRVELQGEVEAVRVADAQHAAMGFRSPTLTVWPNEERAATNTPLVMTQGETIIRARSMEAQNLLGELKLGGGVTGHLPRGKPQAGQ